jgi:hypothetical protein
MLPFYKEFLERIASLVDEVGKDRDFPGLSLDQIGHGQALYNIERTTWKNPLSGHDIP